MPHKIPVRCILDPPRVIDGDRALQQRAQLVLGVCLFENTSYPRLHFRARSARGTKCGRGLSLICHLVLRIHHESCKSATVEMGQMNPNEFKQDERVNCASDRLAVDLAQVHTRVMSGKTTKTATS